MRVVTSLLLWLAVFSAAAQEQRVSWQEVWHDVMSAEELEDDDWQATFELLEQLAETPIDINHATRSELEQLPFLSEQQLTDLQEYVDRYGPVRSMGELRMVASLDYQQLQLLPFFVCIGGEGETQPQKLPLDSMFRRGRQELTATLRIPFYERKGDKNGYLGYRYRHEVRYDFKYGDRVRFGLTGAQDAGEPFLSNRNRWGYDVYSYFAQLRHLGCAEQVVVGKYKLSTGRGLVMGGSLTLGKLVALQRLGRTTETLRPHTSRSEADYLQGAAATWRLSRPWRLTTYVSYRPIDATLDSLGQARTLITSGYHRTEAEMEKKYNTHMTDVGLRLALSSGRLKAGLTAAYTHLDRRLQPATAVLFRRYQAEGRDFANFSADYAYRLSRLSFSGETAIDRHGHVATQNVVGWEPSQRWSLMALQRFYSYRYHSLRAHTLSEGGHVQNESGLMVGATWRPLRHWQLQGYADYAYFPWARQQASRSSSAFDLLVAATGQWARWTLQGRYRRHRRERDNEKGVPEGQVAHQARLSANYSFPQSSWSCMTQADLTRVTDNGWMLSERVSWKHRYGLLCATVAWFSTDSYGSRLYLYERQLPHVFGFPSYYGRGVRAMLLARADLGRWQCHARLGYTRQLDRSTVGSGLQEIAHSFTTDLDLQLRYRF